MSNKRYVENKKIRKIMGTTRIKCKFCGCYKPGRHKIWCQKSMEVPTISFLIGKITYNVVLEKFEVEELPHCEEYVLITTSFKIPKKEFYKMYFEVKLK